MLVDGVGRAWGGVRGAEPGRKFCCAPCCLELLAPILGAPTCSGFPYGPLYETRELCSVVAPPQEKAMATHSSTLAWKIPWKEEPGGLQSMGWLRVYTTERLHFHFSLSCIGEGNGNPLQCSCLENPRDRGAWRAAIYEVAQNQT